MFYAICACEGHTQGSVGVFEDFVCAIEKDGQIRTIALVRNLEVLREGLKIDPDDGSILRRGQFDMILIADGAGGQIELAAIRRGAVCARVEKRKAFADGYDVVGRKVHRIPVVDIHLFSPDTHTRRQNYPERSYSLLRSTCCFY